jgi:uncharacterized membrane protein YkvA (DUF1232 family)
MLRLFRLWQLARQDLGLLWFALRHRQRPVWLLPATVILCLYAIEPLNMAIPLVGFVDDFVLLPLCLHLLLKLLPADIRAGFAQNSLMR